MTAPIANQSTASEPVNTPKMTADWERIEADYRAGTRSLREIATEHKITEGAIRKRAKRDAWERNLKVKVQARADALVRKELVRTEVRKEQTSTEKQTIEIEATVQSRIRLSHRTDIGRMRSLVMHLTAEVELQSLKPEFFIELEQLIAGIPKGATLADMPEGKEKAFKISAGLEKALSLSSRTVTLKALVESFSRLLALEREAFGINSTNQEFEDPFTLMLRSLQGTAKTIVPIAEDPDLLSAP